MGFYSGFFVQLPPNWGKFPDMANYEILILIEPMLSILLVSRRSNRLS